jgi:hypothetical protein
MSIIRAFLRRWFYLISRGLWGGEFAVSCWDERGLKVIGTGSPTSEPGVFSDYKIFWERDRFLKSNVSNKGESR